MRVIIDLEIDESIALRRLANEIGEEPIKAAQIVLREILLATGMLELSDNLVEETETAGSS